MWFETCISNLRSPPPKKSPNLICLATRENGTHICQTCKWRKSTVGTKINSTALYKGLKSVKLCDWKLRLLCNTEWIHHVGHTDMYLSRAVQFLLYVEIKKGCAENPFPYPVIKGYLHNQSDPFFKVNEISLLVKHSKKITSYTLYQTLEFWEKWGAKCELNIHNCT